MRTLAICASIAIDLAVLLGVLYAPRGPIGMKRIALAIRVAVPVSLAKTVVLVVLGSHSFFLAINLAYTALVITVPATGLVVLAAARARETTRPALVFAACALVPAPFGVYATFVEPFRLVEERVAVELAPERRLSEPLRVTVLADLQSREVDDHLRRAIASAMAFDPHLIVIPGDLIQRGVHEYDEAVPQFRELLAQLDAPLGVYFVIGNCDDELRVAKVFEGTRVRMLVDEIAEFEHGGRRIALAGAAFSPLVTGGTPFLSDFEQRSGDYVRLLIAHYPDIARVLSRPSRVDLTIAGHTHGGQVQLPWFGPPITLSTVPRHVAAGGLHDMDGRRIYVSRGVGCERGSAPRIRFLAPPEVSLLTLQ